MKMLKVIVLLVLVVCVIDFKLVAEETITNETIVTMVKAGLGEELIMSKIQASHSQFDVSTETILKLKKDGVSEKIIKAMVDASAKKPEKSEQKPNQIVDPVALFLGLPLMKTVNSHSLYVKSRDKVCAMLPSSVEFAHSMKKHMIPFYFGPGDSWWYIRGEKSVLRLTDKKPIFYTNVNPDSLFLVKLAYNSGKDIRYIVVTGDIFKGNKDTLPLKINKKSEEVFEVFPEKDLALGEYTIIISKIFYDFGIE